MKEFIIKITFKLSDKVISEQLEVDEMTSIKNCIDNLLKEINEESEKEDEVPMNFKILEYEEKECK